MLYKRGNIWWVKFKAGGEVIQRSAGTTSKRKAEEVERALRHKVAKHLHAQRTGKPVTRTYSEAVIKWVESGAPKSMWSHARNTRPYLDKVPLHLVVPAAHNMKQAMLSHGLSPMTINRRLAVVRRVLNVAYKEWDWIDEPLGGKIKLLSEKSMSREFFLSQEEVDTLLAATSNEDARRVMTLAAYTGLRRSEILKLKPENWHKPYIVLFSDTKSGKPRSVPVIEDLHPIMQRLPFMISEWELRKAFEAARESIGRTEIRFHDLRHTYASWLIKNPDIPLTVIRDILGHSNLSVTSKYAHLRGSTIDMVTNAIGGPKGDTPGLH